MAKSSAVRSTNVLPRARRAIGLCNSSVSQFTLYASTKKANKPDFHTAASRSLAKELYDVFFTKVQELHHPEKVKNGVFQAMMDVGLVNDGPVGARIVLFCRYLLIG